EDAGQKLLQSRRLLVIKDLERLQFRLVELGAGFLCQVDNRIERPGCRTDDREPPLERQLLAMLSVDALPGAEDRDFGVDDQAIEVEDQRLDGRAPTLPSPASGGARVSRHDRLRWKNSRMRSSMSTRSCSERGICRSLG